MRTIHFIEDYALCSVTQCIVANSKQRTEAKLEIAWIPHSWLLCGKSQQWKILHPLDNKVKLFSFIRIKREGDFSGRSIHYLNVLFSHQSTIQFYTNADRSLCSSTEWHISWLLSQRNSESSIVWRVTGQTTRYMINAFPFHLRAKTTDST